MSSILGDQISVLSPIDGLSHFNRYVIAYEEKSQKYFEKIQDYVVEVCHNQLLKKSGSCKKIEINTKIFTNLDMKRLRITFYHLGVGCPSRKK